MFNLLKELRQLAHEEEILAYLERHYDESEQADAHRAKAAKARRRYLAEALGPDACAQAASGRAHRRSLRR